MCCAIFTPAMPRSMTAKWPITFPNWRRPIAAGSAFHMATADGQVFDVGDCKQLFTIQSISKPFVYGLALEDHGLEHVLKKVGVEPTGEAFNAIVLDEESNRPFNPMVNAGAIATADLINGQGLSRASQPAVRSCSAAFAAAKYISITRYSCRSATTGHRNRAIGHLMLNFGMVGERIEESLELYFQQCSVLVNCTRSGHHRRDAGQRRREPHHRRSGRSQQQYVKYLLSIMLSCGMYDYAGEWAYRVGIPAKSGVGGGIVGVIPGHFGIGIFSPPLDAKGNSVRGIKVCQELSECYGLHCFETSFSGPSLRDLLSPHAADNRHEGNFNTAAAVGT